MAKVVVIGGGVAGLGSALALSRDGHDVTVLERDAAELPPTPDEAFDHWVRRGAPQARHSHAFLARLRNLLRDRAPDVLGALMDAGASDLPMTANPPPEMVGFEPEPGDEDLVAIACRRITFEWVLRRMIEADGAVRFQPAANVTGLRGEVHDGIALVTGVTTGSIPIVADAVVDAAGRRSSLPAWLEGIGGRRPRDEDVDCGIVYYSRFYRLRDGVEPPAMDGPIGSDLGYLKYALFIGDNRTFSVTYGVSPHDEQLRPALLRPDPFDAAARQLPATAAWVDPERSEPVGDVAVMAALKNRRRSFVVDGEPVALGVYAVGDSSVHTNPLYGRGCSLAFAHAFAFAGVLAEHGLDHDALTAAFEEETRSLLDPWYAASVAQDEAARDMWDLGDGIPSDENPMRSLLRDGLFPAARRDPMVWRAFIRAFNLLDEPDAVMQNPELARRVLEVWQDRANRPPLAPDGPSRSEMIVRAGIS